VVGGWSILHEDELYKLYASPNTIRVIRSRRMRWVGHVASMGEMRYAYNIFIGKPEGNKPLKRPRCRWEDNIGMDLREIGLEIVDWMHLIRNVNQWRAVVNTAVIP
jgi:hypothetical protein